MCKFMCKKNNLLNISCEIIIGFIWMLSVFMVESSGIVIKPGVLCDSMACKCGYDLIICECVQQIQVPAIIFFVIESLCIRLENR